MAHDPAPSTRAAPTPVQPRAARWRRRQGLAGACVLASCLWACGGGGTDAAPGTLELGGGISMTLDGAIVVAAARMAAF
jgi:hypothetical protein